VFERTVDQTTIYDGRVLALEVLRVELEDGRRSVREIVRHARAVGVLPRLPDGRFLLVRQFRKAMEREMIEICAGLVEDGEAPEAAARRELLEETGCRAERLVKLGSLCSSPGYTDEVVDVFFADCRAPGASPDLDDDEHVEVVRASREDVDAMILDGTLFDGKSVAAWHLFALWDARVRQGGA